MSLNSLDSKISPHSLHSTNSESASRLTICTRGCLQGCGGPALGRAEGGLTVINPEAPLHLTTEGEFAAISRYCRTALPLVKWYISGLSFLILGLRRLSRLGSLTTLSLSALDSYHSIRIFIRSLPRLAGRGQDSLQLNTTKKVGILSDQFGRNLAGTRCSSSPRRPTMP